MHDIFLIDHGYPENRDKILKQVPTAKVVRAQDYWILLHRLADRVVTSRFWVLSTCVDYTDFDFNYEPPPWESYQIHCWPSSDQKYGDTFLVPLTAWKQQRNNIGKLEDYEHINYNHDPLPRMPVPEVIYISDNLTSVIKATEFYTPYVLFRRENSEKPQIPAQKLWEKQCLVSLSRDNSTNLVPRQVAGTLNKQIYDYDYLTRQFQSDGEALDIVFISNGEPNAEKNYERLVSIARNRTIHRVKDITGRNLAYRAAAELSKTDWFFAVFAKLEIAQNFNFDWKPDYWQEPKHYIFRAANPVNGLNYGHQALIAYNKNLVLSTTEVRDLDFTLEAPHTVVPINSGIARFNTDAWTTWRTAFREVLKLKHYVQTRTSTLETKVRLESWQIDSGAPFSEDSVRGAQDALDYYAEVQGDLEKLKLSYEWAWLKQRYEARASN